MTSLLFCAAVKFDFSAIFNLVFGLFVKSTFVTEYGNIVETKCLPNWPEPPMQSIFFVNTVDIFCYQYYILWIFYYN